MNSNYIMSLMELTNKQYEQVFLDKWSHVVKKDNEIYMGFFSCGNFIIHVHGCIQQEKDIGFVNPNCKYNFINAKLAKNLKVSTQHIQRTQVKCDNF